RAGFPVRLTAGDRLTSIPGGVPRGLRPGAYPPGADADRVQRAPDPAQESNRSWGRPALHLPAPRGRLRPVPRLRDRPRLMGRSGWPFIRPPLRGMVKVMTRTAYSAGSTLDVDRPTTEDPAPLRAVHTTNFPTLLRQLGASLLVTTYQAGKLVLVRDEGDHLNTHFRTFQAPMGMALAGDRLAIGTTIQVWEFVDVPAVAAKLDPPVRHDACFLPRSGHMPGNIPLHEMARGH